MTTVIIHTSDAFRKPMRSENDQYRAAMVRHFYAKPPVTLPPPIPPRGGAAQQVAP